ncbi:MAG: hypothetical protein HRU78_12780 [Gammaproteobacteria bacterium]|nr:MAG: hypothetical protein HRU78_12780 [Gammaproteobacteria bacterium]
MTEDFLLRYKSGSTIKIINDWRKHEVQNSDVQNIVWVDIKVELPSSTQEKIIRIGGQYVTSIKVVPNDDDPTESRIEINCKVARDREWPKWDTLHQPQIFNLLYQWDSDRIFKKKYKRDIRNHNSWRVNWTEWHKHLFDSSFVEDSYSSEDAYPLFGEWFNPANTTRNLYQNGERNTTCRELMPWDSMGILEKGTNDSAGKANLQVCVWYVPEEGIDKDVHVDGALHVFLYSATILDKNTKVTAALRGMKGVSLLHQMERWCFSPALYITSLSTIHSDSSAFPPGRWSALISWQGRDFVHPRRNKRTDIALQGWESFDFLWLWNRAVETAFASTKLLNGGSPLLGLPVFLNKNIGAIRSNILIDPSSKSHVRHVFPAVREKDKPFSVAFIWNWMDSILDGDTQSAINLSPQTLILENGKFLNKDNKDSILFDQWQSEIIQDWESLPLGDKSKDLYDPYFVTKYEIKNVSIFPIIDQRFEEIFSKILRNYKNTSQNITERILSRFTIQFDSRKVDKNSEIRIGSLIIKPSKPSKPSKEAATLECTLRGSWSSESWDIYPEFKLTLKDCEIHTSGSNDADRDDIYTQLDVVAGDEDRLQRETSSLLYPQSVLATNAEFILRFKSEAGKNSVMEMIVESKSINQGNGKNNGTYFFNARPYVEAQLNSIQFDAESGARIATWRSDDPDGAQWRFGYSEMGFRLPPQAVGEEMERGNRFWTKNHTPYIEKDKPIRFRFSPPTFVTIRPGILDRRYNKNPANLREIIRNSDVERFETEAVYPLSMKFARDQNREPEVRMTEVAEFFGRPAENLPFFDGKIDKKEFPKFISEENLLDDYLAKWYQGVPGVVEQGKASYIKMRSAQSAARINFVSRLAVMHLHDPYRKDHKLFLTKGIEFRLRSRNEGAPALANPLPTGVDFDKDQKKITENFLTKDSIDWENVESIRGGLIHTMEFPSELVAVLRGPVSRNGVIENLSFSALGAWGKVSASFDNGRTTFTAEVQYGQASRIVKTRVGRIGVLWNKANHVIVYERTTVPSLQFESEQGSTLKGWPILRKTEEYIELIEDERLFETEKSAIDNRAGAIFSSKFFTKRIYVNGSWGRDVAHGYEIPLWNKEDTSGFYPKPYAALMTYAAGEDKTRQRHEEPHQLFFYSNTEPQTGSESNAWPAKVLVDFQPGWRFDVTSRENKKGEIPKEELNHVLEASSLPNPGPQMPRNPRFNMAVLSEGPGNVQQNRGESPMLVKFSVLAIERTSLTGNGISDEHLNKSEFENARNNYTNFQELARTSMNAQSIEEEVKKFIDRLDPTRMGIGNLDCMALSEKLRAESKRFFDDLRYRSNQALSEDKLKLPEAINTNAITDSFTKFCEERIQLPVTLLNEFVKNWALKIEGIRQTYEAEGKDKTLKEIEKLETDIRSTRENVKLKLENVSKRVQIIFEQSKSLETIFDETIYNKIKNLDHATEKIAKEVRTAVNDLDAKLAAISDPRLQLIAEQIRSSLARVAIDVELAVTKQDRLGPAKELCLAIKALFSKSKEFIQDTQSILTPPSEDSKDGGKIWRAFNDAMQNYFDDPLIKLKNLPDDAITEQINLLAYNLQDSSQKIEKTLIKEYEKTIVGEVIPGIRKKINDGVIQVLEELRIEFYKNIKAIGKEVSDKIKELEKNVNRVINDSTASCEQLKEELKQLETWANDKVTKVVAGAINSEARKQLESLASQAELFKDKGSQALKLCKAIGDIPSLPHLTFNADRAEYVFDDFKKQIETSPFAMKMREIDDGLKGLGLSIPTRQLRDQFMPDTLKDLDFGKVFKNIAGIDFRNICNGLKIPAINEDHVKVTHGFDKETRSAWAKANVHFESPEESTVFGEKAIAVKMAAMSINATSDFRIGLDGRRTEQTEGVLTCDLALDLSDKRLVKFRQVTITFNNHGKYDFNIAPDKIELHPSLKFISEFAERFQGSLPPAIQIEKDEKGFPTGAKASFETRVENLPPLGAVSIGTLTIASGLNLLVNKGDFQIGTYISVGTRSTPIFVQIGFLGGGVWLEGQTKLVKGKPEYKVTCGLAIGSTRAFTLGGVARGLYSILIFADIQFESTRQHFIVGILIEGSARILGLANACVRLQLEANHSGGKSKGTGTLDVSVKISWCYTLKVRKQVTKEF